ncbi:MMPL family transporter [Sanguibacter inulinus]|uniref:MMPL family transporter n=1 Tax=Sanguibacter inulinus TaxID=60922 RepID=A0A853ESY6_9MICO|nr:MMPL family transporter [Sanguibacter inulinus]MBF0722621.1 MMPL family transporter [Sanguibacter inulinus]NYS93766.1 MMPL family transporter [Sanguibacter inulinus]
MARLLFRLGAFSARHRRLLLVVWLVVLVGLGAVAATSAQLTDEEGLPETESGRALDIVDERFTAPGADDTSELQLVLVADDISTGDAAAAVESLVAQARALPSVATVGDPLDPSAPAVSPDLTTAIVPIAFSGLSDAEAEEAQHAVEALAASARSAGLTAEVGGSVFVEPVELVGPTEAVGAAIAFLVLLLTYGSLVAAGANMLVALLGVLVGTLGVFAFSAAAPIGSITPILAIMLGLAVGIDYGLFVLARFRSELREGRAVDDAVSHAVGTAGTSVVFAGSTVVIALVGLSVVGIPTVTEMGLAAAFAVLVAVLVALTLLPGLMSWAGRRVLPRSERNAPLPGATTTSSPARRGLLERWGHGVVRRPLLALVPTVVLLVVLAVPVLSLQTALKTPGGSDPASTERAAYDLVAEAFGPGAQSPLVVLVEPDGADLATALPQVETMLAGLDGAASVADAQTAPDGSAAIVTVVPATGPLDPATEDLVAAIRATGVDGVQLSVTGTTAFGLDIDALLSTALVTYLLVIVGLSLVLLVLLFRSVLVPVVATAGFLLSFGAGLGVMVAVFQWGWFDAVIQAPQGDPVPSLLPILVVGILFGLAMDYQVFLVSRMHEAHRKGMAPADAVVDGFRRSAGVVAAAATIMTAVFGGFALGLDPLVGSIALALTVGVLADAFLVRMIVVPAVLALLGESAWWLPRWLGRVLPDLDTEGRSLEEPGDPSGTTGARRARPDSPSWQEVGG